MLKLMMFGDKHDGKFVWSIEVLDSRGKNLITDGSAASEAEAKAGMLTALGALVEKLEFSPIDDGTS